MRELPRAARLVIVTVVAAALGLSIFAMGHIDQWLPILVFAVLYVLADSLPVGPGTRTAGLTITVTTPVAIAAYIVLGVWGGVLVALASVCDVTRIAPVPGTSAAAAVTRSVISDFFGQASMVR